MEKDSRKQMLTCLNAPRYEAFKRHVQLIQSLIVHFTLQTRYVRVIHIVCVLLYIIEREISEFEAS